MSSALRRTFLLHDGCLLDLVTTCGCDSRRARPESAVTEPTAPLGATRGDLYGVTALTSIIGHWVGGKLYIAYRSWKGARALAEALRSTRGSESHIHGAIPWHGNQRDGLRVVGEGEMRVVGKAHAQTQSQEGSSGIDTNPDTDTDIDTVKDTSTRSDPAADTITIDYIRNICVNNRTTPAVPTS